MRILSYDIESSTGSHSDGSMCSFGYCICDEKFNIIEQKDLVMSPYTKRFSPHVPLQYDKNFIKSQPKFPYYYDYIKNLFLSADIIIGFSVMNDVDFLNDVCSVYNLPKINYSFYDVQLLYKKLTNKSTLIGLENAMKELGIEYLPHRSDEDARATLLLFKSLLKTNNLTLKTFIQKRVLLEGCNGENEIIPCSDGSLTKKQKTHLINYFRDNVCKIIRKNKGVFERKAFAFSESIRFNDVDYFRRILYSVYENGGKYVPIGVSNYFVIDGDITEKEKRELQKRNENRENTKIIYLLELLKDIKNLQKIEFIEDRNILAKLKSDLKNNKKGG